MDRVNFVNFARLLRMSGLTHLDPQGHARMVDVGGKAETARVAIAQGRIRMTPATLAAIREGDAPRATFWRQRGSAGSWRRRRRASSSPCAIRLRSMRRSGVRLRARWRGGDCHCLAHRPDRGGNGR
jgi:hypothetical protein